MAGCAMGSSLRLIGRNCNRLTPFLQQQPIVLQNVRHNHMFKHLMRNRKHDTKYSYEVSNDPKEWEFVERLMPVETVPVPTPKSHYPSGWRPQKEEACNHPYFVERSRNHMLSVYLRSKPRSQLKVTIVRKIHGDLWRLHDELKAHIEEQVGHKIGSYVHEGNCTVHFKGDHVYYVEQWLLSKGF